MANFMHPRKMFEALIAAGIADESTQRVIIDISINEMPIVHVQKIGDERLFDVIPAVASSATVTETDQL